MMSVKRMTEEGAAPRRDGERGAALVTVLLVATMLLAAGAALIVTTSGAGGVAADATTEMQAYYAAESGMQAAMYVLRHNVASNPAGTEASFREAADNPTLGLWLNYTNVGGQQMVVVSAAPATGYRINVIDPDATPAANEPSRLLIQVRGFGPRGAVRQTEMMLHRSPYDLDPPAAITLIGAETGASMQASNFDIGESSPKGYSGDDQAPTGIAKASFAFTVAADQAVAEAKFASDSKASDSTDDSPSRALLIPQNTLPAWLKTAADARNFLTEVADAAKQTQTPGNAAQDRYFTSSPGKDDFGTDADPLLTFVDGDCDFHGDGNGLLIVTGKLTLNGGANFKGVILLLGDAQLERKGGGGGGIFGALIMGNFTATSTQYLAQPSITTSGGGNSDIKYNSVNVARAFQTFNPVVRDVREF
jgi:hypothetical protein